MTLTGLLSNANLPVGVNWTTLSGPLFGAMEGMTDCIRIAPPPLRLANADALLDAALSCWRADRLFQFQSCARPETPVLMVSALRAFVARSAWVVDPWRYTLEKIDTSTRLQRLSHCFVPYREAYDALMRSGKAGCYHWLPYAADTTVFDTHAAERDIDIFWMGRRLEPLHQALLRLSAETGLKYTYTEMIGQFADPMELGRYVSRCRYFVVTPPNLDNPVRTGGFSPLVMRYLEGLAAGCRLLGVLPGSGEFETILPRESILEIAPDGSDLAEKLRADRDNAAGWEAVARARDIVHAQHGWDSRARQILDIMERG